ncbi:UbiA family prenyltransferase [Microbacterium sp. P02]|uniref:UbiA family prenyltransferase n=1 Tax=Microbacterium sp. P02 TaxID=3366260 RepID=UPI003670B35A
MSLVGALWRSTHPGPSVVVTAVATLLGVAVGLPPWRLILLGVAVLLGQLSVGLSNDAIDARRDREAGRTDKPLARGEASVRSAWIASAVTVAVALALSAALGGWMLVAHAILLASAWSYNVGLKSTPISVVPFIVSFGLLPSLATLSAVDPRPAALWAGAAGGVIGIAIHLTNVLPDFEDDARTGVRGLPHRIGRRASAVIAAIALALGALVVLVGSTLGAPTGGGGTASPTVFAWVVFALAVGLAAAGLALALVRPPGRGVFRLVMLAALMLCVQLAATGQSIAA